MQRGLMAAAGVVIAAFAGSAVAQGFPNKPIRIVVPFPEGGAPANSEQGSRSRDANVRESGAGAAVLLAQAGDTRGFPSKPIRIVVPFPAGGPIDICTRPVAQKLSDALNSPVVVDNRAGANGIVGAENIARSPADGYSMVVAAAGSFAVASAVYPKLPFDVVKDFTPVGLMVTLPELLTVHPSLPVKSVKELVALAKAKPKQLNFATSGMGGMPHLVTELLMISAGIQMSHVPYKGAGPAAMDTIGGQVQVMFADLPVLMPHAKSGRLRALAVSTPQRTPELPAVPTMIEAGYPQVQAANWYALFAPAGTPKDIVARLNTELVKVLNRDDVKSFLHEQGADAAPGTPEQLGALLRDELVKWGKVVRTAGVKVE